MKQTKQSAAGSEPRPGPDDLDAALARVDELKQARHALERRPRPLAELKAAAKAKHAARRQAALTRHAAAIRTGAPLVSAEGLMALFGSMTDGGGVGRATGGELARHAGFIDDIGVLSIDFNAEVERQYAGLAEPANAMPEAACAAALAKLDGEIVEARRAVIAAHVEERRRGRWLDLPADDAEELAKVYVQATSPADLPALAEASALHTGECSGATQHFFDESQSAQRQKNHAAAALSRFKGFRPGSPEDQLRVEEERLVAKLAASALAANDRYERSAQRLAAARRLSDAIATLVSKPPDPVGPPPRVKNESAPIEPRPAPGPRHGSNMPAQGEGA